MTVEEPIRLGRVMTEEGHYRLVQFVGLSAAGDDRANAQVQPVLGDMFGDLQPFGEALPLSTVRLLPPVVPGKIVAVASNFRDHAAEMGRDLPEEPRLFLKPNTAVIGDGESIRIPLDVGRVDYEAELGVVIGRTLIDATPEEAMEGVLGYTCVNDVTARALQKKDGVFGRAKGFDTFCPLGPWIVTGLDPSNLRIRTWVGEELRQDGSTASMVFDVPTLISFISKVMTLVPGDVISTGTPAGVGPLTANATVKIQIEGIGQLTNDVVPRASQAAADEASALGDST